MAASPVPLSIRGEATAGGTSPGMASPKQQMLQTRFLPYGALTRQYQRPPVVLIPLALSLYSVARFLNQQGHQIRLAQGLYLGPLYLSQQEPRILFLDRQHILDLYPNPLLAPIPSLPELALPRPYLKQQDPRTLFQVGYFMHRRCLNYRMHQT